MVFHTPSPLLSYDLPQSSIAPINAFSPVFKATFPTFLTVSFTALLLRALFVPLLMVFHTPFP